MIKLRRAAGALMLTSAATHLSEPFFFGFRAPVLVAAAFGVAFFLIGLGLLRDGRTALWWGAILPALALVLGTANSIHQGHLHPLTMWHMAVDLVVSPSCFLLLARSTRSGVRAA